MNFLELIGSLTGLLYLWLELRVSIYLWPVSILMPAIYLFVYYEAGLYADFGINIYYMIAAIYGWWIWAKKSPKTNNSFITETPTHTILPLCIVFAAIFLIIGWILTNYTDSTVPWTDSFTTAASIIALWMLARKYVEQWLVWMVVDAVSCGLYIYKSLYFTALLYGIYTIIAIFGYYKWKRQMKSTMIYENE